MSRRALLMALLIVGCTGELGVESDGGADGMDGARPGVDGGDGGAGDSDAGDGDAGDGDAGDSDAAGRDAGPPVVFDGGPCAGSLAENFTITDIPGLAASSGAHAAATPEGLAIATSEGGSITLTWVGLDGSTRGSTSVPGNRAWGVAADDAGAAAVLVDRASDEIWAVAYETDGSQRFETRLLGGISHDVTNNEWFGTGIRAGRIHWTGTQWATYHTVQRLWDDGIAHYGDTLRFLDASSGAQGGGGWGWGCSHSMEVRIAQNASGTGPLCVSDCFPGKGVYFNHRTELFVDPSGDCAGRIDTRIGGIASSSSGFWAAFSTPHTRASFDVALIHVGDDNSVGDPVWLTADADDDTDVHIAPLGDGALVGWRAGGTSRLAQVDAAGAVMGSPVDVAEAGLESASDFVSLPGGDVAWVTGAGSSLAIARVRACE